MTQKELGKVIPFTSIAAGAGTNAALMHRTADEAYYACRRRRLQDRYGPELPVPELALSADVVDAKVVEGSDETLDIVGILDEAARESAELDDTMA